MVALLENAVERLRPQAERKHLTLTLVTDKVLGTESVDASRIERAVVNLVQNAIKFTPEGGDITVSGQRLNGSVVVSVKDDGIGIAPEDLPRIFERFYKVDHSRADVGSGIGLAIVKHAVEAHGGSVSAESTIGHGSTLSFSIPSGNTLT
jgi:two-component system phosphate regulon sensor histidine kinase PhoR